MSDAVIYIEKVKERAKQMYAASDQGPWESLPDWMKEMWINAADEEIKKENGGKRA